MYINIRWGNSTCPYGVDTIYFGFAAGSHYINEGAAVEPLCLLPEPHAQYLIAHLAIKIGYHCME